jgi:uncharacterized protein with FMN-binding domain
MRRTTVTVLATIGGIGLMLGLKSLQTATATTAADSSAPSPAAGTGGATTPAPAVTGTYTGDTVDTRYGPVQVRITVTDGEITDVTALQTPSGNPRDEAIAARAVPVLTDEVLAAQSANVDSVSGATYTSDGYLQSLQSALDQING